MKSLTFSFKNEAAWTMSLNLTSLTRALFVLMIVLLR